jgi:hypothetical protein
VKTIRFDRWDGFLHTCDLPGDQSGEYALAVDVRELMEAANSLLEARTLSIEYDIALKELDAIVSKLEASK